MQKAYEKQAKIVFRNYLESYFKNCNSLKTYINYLKKVN